MEIQCDCGKFKALLTNFEENTTGRLVCYCNDCQNFLKRIGRENILDPYGGSEVITVYPSDVEIVTGKELLQCHRLYRKGLDRWTARCCNSPIANTKRKFPWVAIYHTAFVASGKHTMEHFGLVKSRIQGKFSYGNPPFTISIKISFKDLLVVGPFIAKGYLLRKFCRTPFYEQDLITPIVRPNILKE